MLSRLMKITDTTTEYRAWTVKNAAAASCIGRVQGVGSREPLGIGTHCCPSHRNWPSAETCPTAAVGFSVKAAID